MYKVFINEKRLSINNLPNDDEKNIPYDDFTSIEMAMDLLENSSCKSVNLYGEDPDKIWDDFHDSFTNIEAAGGIVKNDENKILFIHRLGKWDLPKGKLEPNESLENAAVREVEEETGIKIKNIRYFGSQPWPYPCGLMVGFNADYDGGDIHLQQSELSKGAWFTKDNLPTIPEPLSIARMILDDWINKTST